MKKLLFGLALACSAVAHAQPRYSISGITTPDGGYASYIGGINNNGWVTGQYVSGGTSQAFLYAGGDVVTLGTMGGVSSTGTKINDQGWVGGSATYGPEGGNSHPFIFDGASMNDLTALDPAVHGSSVSELTNSGKAVLYGFYVQSSPSGFSFAFPNFLVDGSTVTNLANALGGPVQGVNDSGWLTGTTVVGSFPNSSQHAFVYDGTTSTALPNFSSTSTAPSIGIGINNAGWVTGEAASDYGSIGFLYDGTTMHSLGTLLSDPSSFNPAIGFNLSEGLAINDLGVVVGESAYDGGGGNTHAFVYEDGAIADLNALIEPGSGWELTLALDVNNAGQIVGVGTYNGQQRGFILTRLQTADVPEPASWAMMLVGFGLVGAAARRRATPVAA